MVIFISSFLLWHLLIESVVLATLIALATLHFFLNVSLVARTKQSWKGLLQFRRHSFIVFDPAGARLISMVASYVIDLTIIVI